VSINGAIPSFWITGNLRGKNGELTLREALQFASSFPVDKEYLSVLKEYFLNGKLFKGVHDIKKEIKNSDVVYTPTF
jgi:ornithine carbamoyltransferase